MNISLVGGVRVGDEELDVLGVPRVAGAAPREARPERAEVLVDLLGRVLVVFGG